MAGMRMENRLRGVECHPLESWCYHINHDAASAPRIGKIRGQLRNLLAQIVHYQIDVAGGDANGAAYRHWKDDRFSSIGHSVWHQMLTRLRHAVNNVHQKKVTDIDIPIDERWTGDWNTMDEDVAAEALDRLCGAFKMS